MRRTPVVMGVLAMVFGGVQVLMSGVSIVSAYFSKQWMSNAAAATPRLEGQPDMGPAFERMARAAEQLKPYTYAASGALLAFAIALIVVGWMLYKRRAAARPAAVTWAIGALVYLPVQIWVHVMIMLPPTREAAMSMISDAGQASKGVVEAMMQAQGVGTVIFYLLGYTPFPVLLLLLIGRRSAKDDLLPATAG
jgi:hypothetical protein